MTDEIKWEVFDKDEILVEYARERCQRLRTAISEFLSDEETTVEEMIEVIRTEILEQLQFYQQGYDKCQESLLELQRI